MGKTTNPKPRMNFALDENSKKFLEEWAVSEHRTVANLLELIVLQSISQKKQKSLVVEGKP
jgi:hypothetical protein